LGPTIVVTEKRKRKREQKMADACKGHGLFEDELYTGGR
jgi:hypothetical protein